MPNVFYFTNRNDCCLCACVSRERCLMVLGHLEHRTKSRVSRLCFWKHSDNNRRQIEST
jgi:hypothetical protein